MAPNDKFLTFFVERRKKFALKFTRLTWARDFGLLLHDYACTISFRGHTYEGRGLSEDENLAIIKALAEAVERAVVAFNGVNGSGAALHTNLNSAKVSAVTELAERHFFFVSFFRKISFLDITARSRREDSLWRAEIGPPKP